MKHLPLGYTLLGLAVLALASCADETTAPSTTPTVAGPELAVAHNTWLTRRDLPFEVRWPAVAVVPNSAGQSILYVIGGGQPPYDFSADRVQAYNVATNTWSQKARLPYPLYATNGTGVVNGRIYVSGGYYLDENSHIGAPEPSAALFQYNPATNTWTKNAGMPENGANGVTGVINGKLYVVSSCFEPVPDDYYYQECGWVEGGRPGRSNFFRYNPVTDRWARLPSPKAEYHENHMGGVLYNKLYLTDGKTIEVYDPVTNQWTMKVTGGQVRLRAAATVQGGLLYLIGGYQLRQTLRTTKVYHPIPNTWTTAAPMPTGRSDISAMRSSSTADPGSQWLAAVPPATTYSTSLNW
jgi:N-acetylneuraminic acid mutarotase